MVRKNCHLIARHSTTDESDQQKRSLITSTRPLSTGLDIGNSGKLEASLTQLRELTRFSSVVGAGFAVSEGWQEIWSKDLESLREVCRAFALFEELLLKKKFFLGSGPYWGVAGVDNKASITA